jgi:undecaprenyl diphosphate synthase
MHVGLIVDGVRRWSRREGVDLTDGYRRALTGVDTLVRNLFDSGVDSVSLYLLSRDNLQRTPEDLNAVFEATTEFLATSMQRVAHEFDAAFILAGDSRSVPERYRIAIEGLTSMPGKSAALRRVYLLVAYSPAEELADRWAPGLDDMASLVSQLWVPERVDLVIRTGGAALLSDFLPLQSGYARIWWTSASIVDLTWDDIKDEVIQTMELEQLRGR